MGVPKALLYGTRPNLHEGQVHILVQYTAQLGNFIDLEVK